MSADELEGVMDRLDYQRVPDRGPPGLPGVSEAASLLRGGGAYEGDYLRNFIHEELSKRGVTTFGDLRRRDREADRNLKPNQRYKLVLMVTDITHGRLLRLPWDYRLLNLKLDEQLVADAVRASSSIPFYFDPITVRDGKTGEQTTLVDGGVLSNFPIEVFDRTDGQEPRWPTFGVKIIPKLPAGTAELFPEIAMLTAPALHVPPVRLAERVIATAIVGNDQTYLERPCVQRRAIQVDTSDVGITDFGASKDKRAAVAAKDDKAAQRFLDSWNWERYKKDCRGGSDEG
jgi:NTE family protein